MTAERRQNIIIAGFVLLSLLFHLLLLLVPRQKLFPEESKPAPVYVQVRPPQQRERELDLPIRKELEQPRKKPARRLAEKNQVVAKEMAPKGEDAEDRKKAVKAPKLVQSPPPVPKNKPEVPPEPAPQVAEVLPPTPVTPEGWQIKAKEQTRPKLPDLQTLTQISPGALAQIENDWRRKYREEIAKGDTVWMDTEQDLLISFMRRFRTNIYNVWNYPAEAIKKIQEGTCLLRITVDRQGNIADVLLLESSGHRVLDEEAMQAVRQGATYGPLPRAYPNEELKIMAFFQYRLSGVVKHSSRPRPGDIY